MDYGAPEKIRYAGTLWVPFGFPLTKQKAGMQDLCSVQGWCMVLRETGNKITTGLGLRIRLVLSGVERSGDSAPFCTILTAFGAGVKLTKKPYLFM